MWIAYFLGVITLPAAYAALAALLWATGRKWGYGPCPICSHYGGKDGYDIGERSNFMHWFDSMMHRYIWARLKAHKLARGDAERDRIERRIIGAKWDKRYML
jgi:hypothetical protein